MGVNAVGGLCSGTPAVFFLLDVGRGGKLGGVRSRAAFRRVPYAP